MTLKISIWQQFCSNHSSYFWIAGTFNSVEDADAAYHTLRDMLRTIDQWRREHPEESREARRSGDEMPTPVEIELARQHRVEWPKTLDWMNVADYLPLERLDYLIDGVLNVVGRTIIMAEGGTWNGVQPFETLLARLGAAEVVGYDFHQQEAGTAVDVRLDLRCAAPDEAAAASLEQAIRRYLDGPLASDDNPPPWHDDEANIASATAKSGLLRRDHVERATSVWHRNFTQTSKERARDLLRRNRLALERGTLQREGPHLIFEDIWFHNLTLGLSALFAYLIVNECSAIMPQFSAGERQPGNE